MEALSLFGAAQRLIRIAALVVATTCIAAAQDKQLSPRTITSAQIDALWTISDPVAGAEKLHQALKDHPDSADEIHTQLCRCFGLQHMFERAWSELKLVSKNPSTVVNVRVQLEAGRLKNTAGDRKGAMPLFQKALDLAELAHLDYYAVDAAHMLAIAAEGDQAIHWNEKALAMAAASKDARARRWRGSLLNNLGWAYHDSGQLSKALDKFEAAESFQKQYGNATAARIARWAIARCLRSMKRYNDALSILQELVEYPEAGYVSEELGEDLLATGKAKEAKPHFRRAYELLSMDKDFREHEAVRLRRLEKLGS